MTNKKPATIEDYILAAPPAGQPHLRQLHALLKEMAPNAEETIKWGTPFFVEPRFLFAFSAHKAHCSLAPVAAALESFRETCEASGYKTTKGTLLIPYTRVVPEDLVRQIAALSAQLVRERQDDGFW